MDREQSEWNGALEYLHRIDLALQAAGIAAINLDLYSWLHNLKLFYREISSVMKPTEKEELYEEGEHLSNQINIYLKRKQIQKMIRINPELIKSLELFEIKLRTIYKESGLQMRLTEDASRALR